MDSNIYQKTINKLIEAKIPSPRLEARILIAYVTNTDANDINASTIITDDAKIKLDSIPPDQLNFLDLRTIDLSQVEIPEDIDLSSIVLTGVNLSGVYIPKGHFLNMALMAKQKARAKLIIQKTQRTLDLLFQKIKE